MARGGRRNEHLFKSSAETGETTDGGIKRTKLTAWCGETTSWFGEARPGNMPPYWTTFEWADHSICTKCSSRYWAAKLGERNPENQQPLYGFYIGERINTTPTADYRTPMPYGVSRYYWKSLYPVLDRSIVGDCDEDKIVAFIGIQEGWGKHWEIRAWEISRGDNNQRQITVASTIAQRWNELKSSKNGGYDTEAKGFPSKERALAFIADMMERGQLTTYAALKARIVELDEDAQRREQQRAADEAERERLREERARRKADEDRMIAIAFGEMFEEGKISNYQREAAVTALKRLGIEAISPRDLADAMLPPIERLEGAPLAAGEPETDEWGEVIVRG